MADFFAKYAVLILLLACLLIAGLWVVAQWLFKKIIIGSK